MPKAEWKCVAKHEDLQRSSHVVSVIGHTTYIFGGELVPREPRDSNLFSINLDLNEPIISTASPASSPSPRVGSASTTLDGLIYLFSGRGGIAMFPIEEAGGLWSYDPASTAWVFLSPPDTHALHPQARSYHCMTSDGADSIFVHAGCPESGRLSDLWVYSVRQRKWTQLADAPGPARGGTSICYSGGLLYRMNGFDGKTEQGGVLDIFAISSNSWSSKTFTADGFSGPEARSVSALLPVRAGGRDVLITLFGERDPSALGHAGAGKMLDDWWMYDIAADNWVKGMPNAGEVPPARGWFDADVIDGSGILVAGGLSETNERLADVWILSL